MARNPVYEQALAKQGVAWDYLEEVPLEQIDLAKGLRNQARIDNPIDQELVDAYTKADKDGNQFPAVVLWRPGKGRWIPVDGNQRLAAKVKNKRKSTDAYVLGTTDPMVADRVSWTFNNLVNGKRLTQEECLEHAVTFVRKYGYTHTAAAVEWGVPLHRVSAKIRLLDLREIADRDDITKRVNDDALLRLNPLDKAGEDVLFGGIKIVVENGLSQEQISEMVSRVGRARTHADKIKVLDDYAREEEVVVRRAETKGGRVNPSVLPRQKLSSQLSVLVRLLEDYDDKVLRPAGKDKFADCRDKAGQVVERLIAIFGLGVLPRSEPESQKGAAG